MTNINDKALFACFTPIPPQRVQEFSLNRKTNLKTLDNLQEDYDHLIMENENPLCSELAGTEQKENFQIKIKCSRKICKNIKRINRT